MDTPTIVAVTALLTAFIALASVVYFAGVKVSKIEVKVDTMMMMRLNEFPRLADIDGRNSSPVYAKLFGNIFLEYPVRKHLLDLLYLESIQNRCVAFLTLSLTIFLHHVIHIIGLGSDEQVIGTNATGRITSMTNIFAVRDIAIMKLVRKAMGVFVGFAHRNSTITIFSVNTGIPKPTFGRFDNVFPKVVFWGFFSHRIGTFTTAKRSQTCSIHRNGGLALST